MRKVLFLKQSQTFGTQNRCYRKEVKLSLYLTSPFFPRQGYPCELLPLTVAGIPSMHICLDFIPELIAQPELEKQVVTILELDKKFEDIL